jgi:hypothetical protein
VSFDSEVKELLHLSPLPSGERSSARGIRQFIVGTGGARGEPQHGPDELRVQAKKVNLRETLKELAQLDGAFVVSDEGVVLSAARYIDAVSNHLELPLGLGSRHVAAASVSSRTDAVAVAVSESSTVRMFDDGELVAEIVPELWLLGGHGSYLDGSYLDGSSMARETR